jgi:probable addiction module antidote protein
MKLKEFNPVEMLHSKEEVAAYLTDAFQDDDPELFMVALANVIKHNGVGAIAAQSGLNRESLYKVVRRETAPRFTTVKKIMDAAGVKMAVTA